NGTLTFTTAPDANGSASVSVQIHDSGGVANFGVDTSAVQTFAIVVAPVHDTPVATPDTLTVAEDSPATTVDVLANDSSGPDTGETLVIKSVTQGAHGSVTIGSLTAASVSYQPAANYNGPDSFTYTISDGNGGFATATVTVTVTAVNDAPSFVKGADQLSLAGAGPQTVIGWATGISAGPPDEATQTVTFAVSTDNPALFAVAPTIAPNGTLTYTPVAAGGAARVTVPLKDTRGHAGRGRC